MKQVNHFTFVECTSINCALFFYEADLLFLAVSQENQKLFVYIISEVTKLNNNSDKQIFKMPLNNSNTISETLVANKTMIAVTLDSGFLLINSSNPNQIKIISQYLVPPRMIGICNSIIFSDDSKLQILAMRNYGFISVDISDPTQPIFGDEIQTLGGEFVQSSITKNNYAYISDGYKRFVILDLKQLPNFKILRYQIDGWLNHITKKNLLNPIISQFFRADGSIRFSKIIQYMIQEKISFSYKNQSYQAKSLIKDLKDQHSRLYKCIRAVIVRYVLQFDERTQLFFEFLKEDAKSRFNYTQKDWYKHYILINRSSSIVNENLQIICFPNVLIKKDIIKQTLVNLRLINQNEIMEKAISKAFTNLSLVYELLITGALGLLDYTPNTFQKSQSKSIHLNFFQISSVEAFKAIKNPGCQRLRKMMNITLANYGATQNMKLPNWIKFDQKSVCKEEFPLKVVDEEKEIQYELDVDSIANTTRKSFSQDQKTSTSLFFKNNVISEIGSPTQFQNSSNNQIKPSLFSNFINPSLINNKLQKGPPSIFKKESDIENNDNKQDSKENQQCSPIYSQDEGNEPSQQNEFNEKENASSSFYTQKQIQSSKIEESLDLDKNCSNKSPKQKKYQKYLKENNSVKTKKKEIGLNMKMEMFEMIQKSKSISTEQIIDIQDAKIIEEQSIIDQSNQKQTPNQFSHNQNHKEYFHQQRNSDQIQL
ncbi:hypothetical protein ABPG72_006504 [Tetrahymena utriculariae]